LSVSLWESRPESDGYNVEQLKVVPPQTFPSGLTRSDAARLQFQLEISNDNVLVGSLRIAEQQELARRQMKTAAFEHRREGALKFLRALPVLTYPT